MRCVKAALEMGARIFTGEFWYQKGQDYKKVISDSNRFLREKIEEAAEDILTV